MKAIMKQKFFLFGILLFVAAIAIGVCNHMMHPKISVVSTMEKGFQKENVKMLKGIVAPSIREKDDFLDEELQIKLGLFKLENGFSWKNYHILQGNVLKDEEGNVVGVNTIQIIIIDDDVDVTLNKIGLTNEDGKLYIADGLY